MTAPLPDDPNSSATKLDKVPQPPKRKEAYTTYLYIGFAVLVAVLTVVGFLWW
jgi:hypothetical protein